MFAIQEYSSVFTRLSFIFFIFLTFGCDLSDPPLQDIENTDNLSFIPNSVWISNAEAQIGNSQNTDSTYMLFSELNGNSPFELAMLFGADHALLSVDILGDQNLIQKLYFENGKITFSHYLDHTAAIEWIFAYANEKPYAAAARTGENWKAIHPQDIPIDQSLIRKTVKKAKQYLQKEKNQDYTHRILQTQETVTGKFGPENELHFALNVRKGEKVNLKLESSYPGIYFTVYPNNGSNMEHRNWKDTKPESGDLNITVFSVDTTPEQEFTLFIKTINRQSPTFARVE